MQCQETKATKITLKNRNSATHNSLLVERKSQFTKSQSEVASSGSTVYVRNFCARNFRNFHKFWEKSPKLSSQNKKTSSFVKIYPAKIFWLSYSGKFILQKFSSFFKFLFFSDNSAEKFNWTKAYSVVSDAV